MDARSQIECSFRELLETQPYGKITVQDICDRAKEAAATLNAMRTAVPPERGERI